MRKKFSVLFFFLFLSVVFSLPQSPFTIPEVEGATITYVNVAVRSKVASGNMNPSAPSSVANDIWIAFAMQKDNVVSTMTADWTQIYGVNNGATSRASAWWVRYNGTTPTRTITRASGNTGIAYIVAIRGAVTSGGSPIDAYATQVTSPAGYGVVAPDVTTTNNGAFVLFTVHGALAGSMLTNFNGDNPEAEVKYVDDNTLLGTDAGLVGFYGLKVYSGSTTARNGEYTKSALHVSSTIALKPSGVLSYSWVDSSNTVTISNTGDASTLTWKMLWQADKFANKSHLLGLGAAPSYPTGELTYLRPLDSMAVPLWLYVTSFVTGDTLNITGTDGGGVAQTENVTISANGWVQTTKAWKTVTTITDTGIGNFSYDVYQDRWGIWGINPDSGGITTDYLLQGGIVIENNVTFVVSWGTTSFPIANHKLTMKMRSGDTEPNYYIKVNSGGTATFGAGSSTYPSSGTSVTIITRLTAAGNLGQLYNNGTMNFYGGSISTTSGTNMGVESTSTATTRLSGVTVNQFMLYGEGYDIQNSIWTGGLFFVHAQTVTWGGTIDRVTLLGTSYILYPYLLLGSNNITLSNVYSRGHAKVIFDLGGAAAYSANYFFVNPDFDTWGMAFNNPNWNGKAWRKYTFDAHTQLENGTLLAGVSAVGEYSNSYGQAFSVTSNGNGDITSQTVDYGFYNATGGSVAYLKAPLKVTYSKAGYQNLVKYYNMTEKTRDIVVLKPNNPPVARFTYSPINPQPSQMVTFNGSLSVDRDGSITSYSWNFGDLQTGSGSTVQHAYASAGTYTVTLTVTDNQVSTDDFPQSVYVESISVGGGQNVGLNIAPNFDINILKMPQVVVSTMPWSRTFTMKTTVHNKGSFQQEVTLAYWLTLAGKSPKVWEGKQSFLLQSKETRPVDIEYPIPQGIGNYTAYAQVTYPSGSEGSLVQQTFTTYDVLSYPLTLPILVIVGAVVIAVVGVWAWKEDKFDALLE